MTDEQPPNCESCPKQHTKDCPIDFEKSNGNSDIFGGMNRVTRNCLMGCHPDTKAWLMKDVMKELERRANMLGGEYAVAYMSAILLIKGDGK